MGLGLLGRGVNDAAFLAEAGAQVLVTDLKTRDQLEPSLKKLEKYPNIKYVLGEHRLEDFRNCDLVLKAGGVPLDSIYIAEARKHGIPVHMDEALFCELIPEGVVTVGVTGTRGKSTVTHMIYEIVRAAKRRVFLGGNVRGAATLPLLEKVKAGDVVVMELDSWRLQGFGDAKISPRVSVFASFMPDHMNYYKGDENRYFEDKSNIYLFQEEGDTLVVSRDIAKGHSMETGGVIVPFTAKQFPRGWKTKLLGEHNQHNATAAIFAARALGIKDSVIKKAIAGFKSVEGRLEVLGQKRGITFINDNNATTPEATVAALKAIPRAKKTILIMGGTDKGLDMAPLAKAILKYAKGLVLFKESGTEKFKSLLVGRGFKKMPVVECDGLSECMEKALEIARSGDTILFSPAFSSFGKWFKNEYERNDQFVSLFKKVKAVKKPKAKAKSKKKKRI